MRCVRRSGWHLGLLAGVLTLLASVEPASAQIGVTILGRVEDRTSREAIEGARVLLPDSSSFVFTDSLGAFTVSIPIGLPLAVHVDQFGYLSQRFDLPDDARRKISVLRLEPNPIAIEGIEVVGEAQVTRVLRDLRRRRNAYYGSARAYDRTRLERSVGSVWNFVRSRAGVIYECIEAPSGLCVRGRGVTSFRNPFNEDHVRVCVNNWEARGAVSWLSSMDLRDVALVEIYGFGGRGGIRVYTPQYLVNRAATGRRVVNPYGC